ncbi:MAG: glutamate synthase central domain-containing protein, partial [Planctomycetaceae bacterium]
ETKEHCHQLRLRQPILTNADLESIRASSIGKIRAHTISTVYEVAGGEKALRSALDRIRREAHEAVLRGAALLILSDLGVDAKHAAIPALLACAGVHHHLIREGSRTRCALIIESGEPREVHHYALLFGYGAGAVNPYLVFESLAQLAGRGELKNAKGPVDFAAAEKNYIKAVNKGLLKVMSKMGISTLHSYRGAQIFEAVGLNKAFVDEFFTRTATRIQGIGLEEIAIEVQRRHQSAHPTVVVPENLDLDVGGQYQWRRRGEFHMVNPEMVAKLQHAVRSNNRDAYRRYADFVNNQQRNLATLRGLLEFRFASHPIPLDKVEPVESLLRRFATGAMSLGSISREAHETLAIAMNRIGGKSNTGEGCEDSVRYRPDANGDLRRSAIKQVASGRFGVTINYL